MIMLDYAGMKKSIPMNKIGLQLAKFKLLKALTGNRLNDFVSTVFIIGTLADWSPILLKKGINVAINIV